MAGAVQAPPSVPTARPADRSGVSEWTDPVPIRQEIFSPDRFATHAMALADRQTVVPHARRVVPVLRRLQDDARALVRDYEAIVAAVGQKRVITPAAEWLIDNFHKVEVNIRQIRGDLPNSYFQQLPKLGDGFLEGHPRILGIVWEYVAHTDSLLDPELLGQYIRAYERRKALSLGELWAVAITLRFVLIENLRRQADVVVSSATHRYRADELADQLLGIYGDRVPLAQAIPDYRTLIPTRAFAVQLLKRVSADPQHDVAEWLHGRLAAIQLSPEEAINQEHHAQAVAAVTMRNIFTSLQLIADVNWENWLESVSLIEAELRTRPDYAEQDFATRNRYRSAVERLARGSLQEEIDVTRAALARAANSTGPLQRNVGYWLIDDGLPDLEHSLGYRRSLRERWVRGWRALGVTGYVGQLTVWNLILVAAILAPIFLLAPGLGWGLLIILAVLAGIPLSDVAMALVNRRTARVFHAELLPALELRKGVPPEFRTLVVIPTLLTSPDGVDELLDQLEVHFLANDEGEIYFGMASDWADSTEQLTTADQELLDRARRGLADLNRRHGERFFLFHRERRFNRADGMWMGWERKRGKLAELNGVLRGATGTSYIVTDGPAPGPFRFVITLDSDTLLPRESARQMIGRMAHPLNKAYFDPTAARVVRGYGILQPRVTPSLPMREGTSFFQHIYSTQRGFDSYAFAVSDAYQDLFGEGSFAGKGIYDIDAVESALEDRIPDNSLLSHDLLEGALARSGLTTDIEVIEEHPTSYAVTASRNHRWVRGDWQLLPWLLWRTRGLTALSRWKLLDNLRRSVTSIGWVAAFLAGLALLPVTAAAVWIVLLALVFYLPPLLPLLPQLWNWQRRVTVRSQLRSLVEDFWQGVLLSSMNLTLVTHDAWLNLDAIVRTCWRQLVSHRRLLEWKTAAAAARTAGQGSKYYYRLMWPGLLVPAAALGIALWRGPWMLLVVAVPVVLWSLAPWITARVSRTTVPTDVEVGPEDRAELRAIARRTWEFFNTFVNKRENYLPPDNFQEQPEPVVANRTSPTNLGLLLLTTMAAYDLGWIGRRDMVDRLAATISTMGKLERYGGHFYNWYDTRTLRPLHPRYVSSVDSGNLAGHLLAVANGCCELRERRGRSIDIGDGLSDAVVVLMQSLRESGLSEQFEHTPVLDKLLDLVAECGPNPSLAALREIRSAAETLGQAFGDHSSQPGPSQWTAALISSIDSLVRDHAPYSGDEPDADEQLTWIEQRCRRLFWEMDFGFLYNRQRRLLSVGYNVDADEMDENCYDLLASEARLASFVGVAKGDLPTKHWYLLGRVVTAVGGGAALLSWSGSMFEYLMPPLVLRAPLDSLLRRTAELSVRRQMEYAAARGVPWGISEAAYNARDLEFTYQYGPFGVPGLGIVRGLANNLVIAPYATGLAAMVDPEAAAANYRRLVDRGARGRYGFYESLDFTPARVPEKHDHAVVHCYMAHHQGMTIVAIHNAVLQGLTRDRFHSDPLVRATELVLQERAPRDVPVTYARREELLSSVLVRSDVPQVERYLQGADALRPAIHHLSNGRLNLTVTAAGAEWLTWQGVAVGRWHIDRTSDEVTSCIYLSDTESGDVWSAGALPMMGDPEDYEVRFSQQRAERTRHHGDLVSELDYHLSPDNDAMVQRLTVRNSGDTARRLSICSYTELALQRPGDDDAHPAFSKMFVHTEYLPELKTIIATRRRRSASDPEIWAARMCYVTEHAIGEPQAETDREVFLGRGNSTRAPQALRGGGFQGTTGFVLDPVFALSQDIEVPAGGRVRLHFWTLLARTRDELMRLIENHRTTEAYARTSMLAWTQSQVQLRHLGIDDAQADLFQTLAGHVLMPDPGLRPDSAELVAKAGSQSDLWPLGISGDLPIVLVRIADRAHFELVRQLSIAFEFWHLQNLAVDLVVVNTRASTYVEELSTALEDLARSVQPRPDSPGQAGRIFVVRADQVAGQSLDALTAAASIVLDAAAGNLVDQIRLRGEGLNAPSAPPTQDLRTLPVPTPPVPGALPGLEYDNGYGGFTADGHEYVSLLDSPRSTPGPWTNVVANEQFGFHATVEGAGYTWWRNSRDNQLTPWRNDPVATPMSEVIYVRDMRTGKLATVTAAPLHEGRHTAWHGFGYTGYYHDTGDLHLTLTQFVPGEDPVKLSWLKITNHSTQWREVEVTAYYEVVLGLHRSRTQHHLSSSTDPGCGALFVRNAWNSAFADQVVFLDFAGEQASSTTDRTEFLGRHGALDRPVAVTSGEPLSGRMGTGFDPCAAMQQKLGIDPGATVEVLVIFGAAHDEIEARTLVQRHRRTVPERSLAEVKDHWQRSLGAIRVRTPDHSFNIMMNGWLLYQSLACRMIARSGYYQASGAYGFRDQLQDSMAVVVVDPALARSHLLVAAARQFVEGDVQHWWLPATGMGVRTRISDDVVWLANAVARYIKVTGDVDVLDEQVPFLEGDELAADEHERFFQPSTSSWTASLYAHCRLALRRSFTTGPRGLPLIGTGDWNDGMNRVGQNGQGESVWLGWFQHATLSDFLPLVDARADRQFAAECRQRQDRLLEALEQAGWDGGWYRRGYFDEGTPLGSASRPECQIDAIAQSWAVLSGACQPERAEQVMTAVEERLIDQRGQLHRLFTPPFRDSEPDPGYIRSYPAGVRENGGQYTHGVIWTIFALAKLNKQDKAGALMHLLNPINHALDAHAAEHYRTEPYVLAADVYAEEPHVGRGGWTWYTGSSGWFYRAGLEAILGVRREGMSLVIDPCLPPEWTFAEVRYDLRSAGLGVYEIVMEASGAAPRTTVSLQLDGSEMLDVTRLPLSRDGATHQVRVILRGPDPDIAVES